MGRQDDIAELRQLIALAEEALERIIKIPKVEPMPAGLPLHLFDLVYRERRMRDRAFGEPGLFGEPAWDILLGLARAEAQGRTSSATALCSDSCVPETTALRWIRQLEDKGYIARERDPNDQRRVYLGLTGKAWDQLRRYAADARALREHHPVGLTH